MPSFNTMDPERIRALLDATDEKGEKLYPDLLSPLAKQEAAVFHSVPCPKCQNGAVSAVLDSHRPFSKGSPLPNRIARCILCQTEFDPKTGLILSAKIIDG